MPPFPCSKTSHTVTVYSLSEYAPKLTEKKKKRCISLLEVVKALYILQKFLSKLQETTDVVHKIWPEAHKNLAVSSELLLIYRFKITVEEAIRYWIICGVSWLCI